MATKSYKAPGSKSPKRQSRREKVAAVKAKKVKLLPYEVRWDYTARIEL